MSGPQELVPYCDTSGTEPGSALGLGHSPRGTGGDSELLSLAGGAAAVCCPVNGGRGGEHLNCHE